VHPVLEAATWTGRESRMVPTAIRDLAPAHECDELVAIGDR